MTNPMHTATATQLASLTRSRVFTPVTTLWADVDTRLQPVPVVVQQTEHEVEHFGNWIIGISYTSVNDSENPSTVVVSMWTTKPDEGAHEVMVSKMIDVLRSHYTCCLTETSPISRMDCSVPVSLLYNPHEDGGSN